MQPRQHAVAALSRLTRPVQFPVNHSRLYRTKNGLKKLELVANADLPTLDNAPPSPPPPTLDDTPVEPPKATRKRKPKSPTPAATPQIAPGSQHHDSLQSFLDYTTRTRLDTASKVYLGTHYEYTVADSLQRLRFSLTRVGRASDRGIDLLGDWTILFRPRPLKVLVQCKAEAPRPAMVRELEGAVVGAPVAWRADGVLAMLVASKEATKGVREAITRTTIPMAFLNVTPEGIIRQFVWNQAAVDCGLETVGVTIRYSAHQHHEIVLTSNGRPWPER